MPPKSGVRKPHRFKSGTVALRDVRRAQKETTLMIRRTPFERLARHAVAQFKTDIRFSGDALEHLQVALEGYLTKLLEKAVLAMVQRNTVTLFPKDVQLVRAIRANDFDMADPWGVDGLEEVTDADILRIARRGGATRVSGLVYPEIRSVIAGYLNIVLRDAVLYMESGRRKTLSGEDVKMALHRHGQTLYA